MCFQWYLFLNLMCLYTLTSATGNFGLTKLRIQKFETCKGPKRKDCCLVSVKIINSTTMTQSFKVHENIKLTHGKIVGTQNGKELLKFPVKRPCNNMIVQMIFQSYIKITDDCTVLKGNYSITVDLQEMSQKYYNGQYFYGNLTIKSNYYGDTCNFFCTLLQLEISPRNEK